jgi:cytochrome c oxidase subunit II
MNPVQGVDRTFWYILGISAVLLIGITVVMIGFAITYRRSKNPVAADIRGNTILEITWTLIPTLIALSMFYFGWKSYIGLRSVPKGAMEIQVTGQMYYWSFVYDNGKESDDELVVPLGRAIKLNVISTDVIHSFYLPAFRIKVDAVKGMPTYAWFMADELGEYDILCTEYCGIGHSSMVAKLRIVPQADFQKWLEQKAK